MEWNSLSGKAIFIQGIETVTGIVRDYYIIENPKFMYWTADRHRSPEPQKTCSAFIKERHTDSV